MKIKDVTAPADKGGLDNEQRFRIKASAKAFDILSSRLYTNVVQAVLRELSTNAWDAHVEAGHEEPFEVHLPTSSETYFLIRDFGPGMSREKVEGLYSTYFDSDKTDSNDVVGCLGLGSKSPYAYADSFTVTSYYGGRRLVYFMYREDGLPRLSLVDDSPSSQPSGLEVKLEVQPTDINQFLQEAADIYQYFPVQPKWTGAVPQIPEWTPVLEGEGWSLGESHRTDWYYTTYIRPTAK